MALKIKKILRKEIVTVAERRALGKMTDLRIDPETHRGHDRGCRQLWQ